MMYPPAFPGCPTRLHRPTVTWVAPGAASGVVQPGSLRSPVPWPSCPQPTALPAAPYPRSCTPSRWPLLTALTSTGPSPRLTPRTPHDCVPCCGEHHPPAPPTPLHSSIPHLQARDHWCTTNQPPPSAAGIHTQPPRPSLLMALRHLALYHRMCSATPHPTAPTPQTAGPPPPPPHPKQLTPVAPRDHVLQGRQGEGCAQGMQGRGGEGDTWVGKGMVLMRRGA